MRKLVFVLALFLLLAAQIGQAADLQAGWYVKVTSVSIWKYVWDPMNHYYYQQGFGNGYFSLPTGRYGPFQVTSTDSLQTDIFVTVPATTQASAMDILKLPFTISNGVTNAYMDFNCLTNYDPTQMYVSLWQVMGNGGDVLLWSQLNGGPRAGSPEIFQPVTSYNYYFLVTVVPEPSSAICMAAAFLSPIGLKARKRL